MSKRPILALDVDGPLALQGGQEGAEFLELSVGEIPLTISRLLPARLQKLVPHFQILWSTSWEREASYQIAPLVGLETGLPFIQFGRYPQPRLGESRKLPALQTWLKNRPAAIVDDEIGLDMYAWASKREAPTLLVEIDPRHGLQGEHVETLLHFARRL